ncbi:MAG: phosphosulfolactate synthase [Bdellovibrionales bacterium]
MVRKIVAPSISWTEVLGDVRSERSSKPRKTGLTVVIDKFMSPSQLDQLLSDSAPFIDFVKLGFGTGVLLDDAVLRKKVEVALRQNVAMLLGGTVFELAYRRDSVASYFDKLADLGINSVEISDGSLIVEQSAREKWIRRARSMGFTVFAEIGKKDPRLKMEPEEILRQVERDFSAGANWVIHEGRESGLGVGIYGRDGSVDESLFEKLVKSCDGVPTIWEAPLKNQQAFLIQKLGPNVNLGNIQPTDVLALEALRCRLRWETIQP